MDNVTYVKDDDTMFLNGTFPVNHVKLGEHNYLLIGHRHNIHYAGGENAVQDYHGDGINVFKVSDQGDLVLHSLLKDNEDIRLKGSTRIEVIKVNEEKALVFIGTRDDTGIQICSLGQDGILNPISFINVGYAIYNGMTVRKVGDQWYLLVGAYDKNKLELYAIDF